MLGMSVWSGRGADVVSKLREQPVLIALKSQAGQVKPFTIARLELASRLSTERSSSEGMCMNPF